MVGVKEHHDVDHCLLILPLLYLPPLAGQPARCTRLLYLGLACTLPHALFWAFCYHLLMCVRRGESGNKVPDTRRIVWKFPAGGLDLDGDEADRLYLLSRLCLASHDQVISPQHSTGHSLWYHHAQAQKCIDGHEQVYTFTHTNAYTSTIAGGNADKTVRESACVRERERETTSARRGKNTPSNHLIWD
jgi:hypothetical protein